MRRVFGTVFCKMQTMRCARHHPEMCGGGGVVKKNTRIGENNRALCCGLQVTHTSTRNEIYPFRSYAYGIYVDDFGFFPPAILTHHRCMRWRDFQWNSKKRKTEYKIHDELDKRKLVGMALCAMCVRQQYGEQTPIANVGDIITIFSFRFIAVMWPTNETSVRTHAPCNRCQAIIAPTTCAYAHKMHERAHRTHTHTIIVFQWREWFHIQCGAFNSIKLNWMLLLWVLYIFIPHMIIMWIWYGIECKRLMRIWCLEPARTTQNRRGAIYLFAPMERRVRIAANAKSCFISFCFVAAADRIDHSLPRSRNSEYLGVHRKYSYRLVARRFFLSNVTSM